MVLDDISMIKGTDTKATLSMIKNKEKDICFT